MTEPTEILPEHERACRALYDAECALHAARQSHVPQWIAAAAERLHTAVLYLESQSPGVPARTA